MARKKKTSSKSPQQTDSVYLDNLTFDPKLWNSPIAFLLNNIRVLFLLILSLVLAGLYSFFTLPRELNPEVSIPILTV